MQKSNFQMPAYLKALSVMVFIIVLVFFLIVGKSLLIPIFMGGFFAILFTPLSDFLEKYRIPRTVAAVISLLTMMLLVAGLLSFIIGNVASFTQDFTGVSDRLSQMIGQADHWITDTFGLPSNLGAQLDLDILLKYINKNSSSISAFALETIGSLTGLVLIPLFMFFLLLYRSHLTQMMVMIYKDHEPQQVKEKISSLRKVIQNYISGVGKGMVILAILNIIAYSIIGVKHAVFFGVLGAILNIIPYVGPLIGVTLPIIYAFLTMDSLLYPVLIIGAYQIIQLLEGNFLTPKIVGGNVNLNAFMTFLGLLIGGSIWGIAGMILVIPTLAILREIFDLSENTKPFALLLGEEKEEKKEETKDQSQDEK